MHASRVSLTLGALLLWASRPALSQESRPQDPLEEALRRIRALEEEIGRLRFQLEEPAPSPPQAIPEFLNALNPRLTFFGNAVGRIDSHEVVNDDGDRIDDRFSLRESEVDLRAAVDPFVDGVGIVTLEEESPGEFDVSVEEGYAQVKRLPLPVLDEPPWELTWKVGRFRTSFGRMNLLHTHDLPQTTRPLVLDEFLGDEGSIGDGLGARVFLPAEALDELSTLELRLEGWTGDLPGSSQSGNQGLVELRWSRPFAEAHLVELAGIAHRADAVGETERQAVPTYSVDFLYRWRPTGRSAYAGAVVGAQAFWGRRLFEEDDGAGNLVTDVSSPFGGYVFGQWQFDRNTFAGVRYDYTQPSDASTGHAQAIYPYLSWYPTEFFRFRVGYQRVAFDGIDEPDLGTFFFEFNFIFGSHPPEPYWVHR
jgi:hypothetical protein